MFIQDTTPDTSAYMIAGYSIFFILLAIYLLSLYIRSRNLTEDLKILENMEGQNQTAKTKMKTGGAELSEPVGASRPSTKRKKATTKTGGSSQAKKKVARKK